MVTKDLQLVFLSELIERLSGIYFWAIIHYAY